MVNGLRNRFLVIRHGESIANRQGVIISQPENGLDAYGLTNLGVTQVTETAVRARLDENVLIISSDFKRTRETAEVLHSVMGVRQPIRYSKRLRERDFGEWELLDDWHYQKVWDSDLNDNLYAGDGVESVSSVLQRAMSLVEEIDDEYQNETILLVGHGDVLNILVTHFFQLDPRNHRVIPGINNAELRSLKKNALLKIA